MASIDKRGGGFRVRWRDPDGETRSRQCPDATTAKKLKREVEQAVAAGRRWEPRDARPVPDLDEVMKAYIAECVEHCQTSTVTLYARHIDGFLDWLRARDGRRGRLAPDVLSRAVTREWHTSLADGGRHGHGRGLNTRKKMVQTVEAAWAWAFESEEYGDYVPKPTRLRKLKTDPGKPTVAPTWAEMDACIAAASGPVRQLAILLRFTGLRVQQGMGLEWRHFDLDRGILYFPGELGKTEQERTGRTIPVSPHLVHELASWGRREGYVVSSNRKAGPYARVARQRDMIRAWKQAGVRQEIWEGESHHCFRNGFVSGLKRAGADDEAVEYLVGHSLGLRGCYTDPDALPLRDAVNLIPAIGSTRDKKAVKLDERRGASKR